MHRFHGRCHCGNLEVDYRTATAPQDATVRACQCSFCRKHDARALSDPSGAIEITAHDPDRLQRYRFGMRSIEFLLCRDCGVYVAAYMADGGDAVANIMVNVLDDRERFGVKTAPADYDTEDAEAKRLRRRAKWTPATLRLGKT